jgi:hypothetical protein
MGFNLFGMSSDSTSQTYDERMGAGDASTLLRDSLLNAVSSGVVVSPNSNLTGNVTLNDPATAKLAVTEMSNFGGKVLDTLANFLTGQAASSNAQAEATNDLMASLAKSQQTGGASDVNKNIVYIVLGGLALVAVIFIWSK